MLRLTSQQRTALGETRRQLANLVAAALVLSQVVTCIAVCGVVREAEVDRRVRRADAQGGMPRDVGHPFAAVEDDSSVAKPFEVLLFGAHGRRMLARRSPLISAVARD